jgi:hypothetical protein
MLMSVMIGCSSSPAPSCASDRQRIDGAVDVLAVPAPASAIYVPTPRDLPKRDLRAWQKTHHSPVARTAV